MRIISGTLKSRRITAPKNLPVRPTTDLSKESLFNILNNLYHFQGLDVLDLFSGTGNISYEFGSRGTQSITAVDADFKCYKFIEQTAKTLELPIQAIKCDVFSYLENKTKHQYDVIFADPPYDMKQEQFEQLVRVVFEKNLLTEDGILIVEHSKHTKFPPSEYLSFEKKYGGSVFSFFELPKE
ncbi:MAG: 16S rRNA (guanine(966)-N(2))-methyltransferase RsmD [Flavobacteriales bacterium]|nr:16S rRNA (guanine(966)-N(2))-methyltransferase RsmD [Flavobacteriales bacterium]